MEANKDKENQIKKLWNEFTDNFKDIILTAPNLIFSERGHNNKMEDKQSAQELIEDVEQPQNKSIDRLQKDFVEVDPLGFCNFQDPFNLLGI